MTRSGDGVEFRVTVGLGQDSTDPVVLGDRAAQLQRSAAGLGGGTDPIVVVDLVKAALQVVLAVDAADALTASQRALAAAGRSLHEAQLEAPTTVVTLEAEAVPAAAQDLPLPPHPVSTDQADLPAEPG